MSDTSTNRFNAMGDNADRAAFTPNPGTPTPTPAQGYTFFDTDDNVLYAWDGSGWVGAFSGAGNVNAGGTLTSGQLVVGAGSTDVAVGDLSGDVTTSGGTTTTLKTAAKTRPITFAVDGGGSALNVGTQADVYVPYACTITAVTMLADQTGDVEVDIWKAAFGAFPPTIADTITASALPTITASDNSQDVTLTGWTTSISAGDTLRFNVDSASAITRLSLTLTVTV